MKTRIIYCKAFLIFLLLIAGNAYASVEAREAMWAQKVKKVIRTYQVGAKDRLAIENKYGSVTVTTWDKNEFKVEVTIIANDETDEKAQRQLDRVSISDSKSGNEVRFVTNIENKGNWGSSKGEKHGLEINYVINMPKSNPLSISNKYGATTVPDFNGPLSISSSYGSFTGGSLNSSDNSITVKYGSSVIESIKRGSLDFGYSKLTLRTAGELSLNHRYGALDIGDVNVISANIDYSSIRINSIKESGSLNTKYSSGIKLSNVPKSLKFLSINSDYSGVNLDFNEQAAFDISVNVSYGDFGYEKSKGANVSQGSNEGMDWKPTKSYSGRYGTGAANGKISINVKYGSVKFN